MTSQIKLVFAWVLLLAWTPLAAQDLTVRDTQQELELYEADLHRFEAEGNYHDLKLVEPLARIADQFMELNRFAEADAALDRAQQIVRIEEGLFTKNQLPFLLKKIQNHVNSGNWREARKLQDHLAWFYISKYSWPDQTMMRGLMELSRLHMQGITADEEEQQGYHYLRAAYSNRVALYVAENVWPQRERRKAGLIYEQLRIMYLQASAIRKGGSTGETLRTTGTQFGTYGNSYERVVSPGSALGSLSINGIRYLERIRQIFADEDNEDPEALAMVKLYQADWHLLFDSKAQALEAYRESYELMVRAGVPRDAIDELLKQPSLIPEPAFYASVEQALQARSRQPVDAAAAFEQGIPVKVFFEELPPLSDALAAEKLGMFATRDWQTVAVFSFYLPGDGDVELRTGWRRKNALGVAQNLQLVQLDDFPVYLEPEPLVRNLSRLRFRPGLTEGEPHIMEGIISYLIASE